MSITHDQIRVRRSIESRVTLAALTLLRDAGFDLQSLNGGNRVSASADDPIAMADAIADCLSCDEARVIATKEGKRASLLFVYGNSGWDSLSDHSESLSEALEPLNRRLDEFMAEADAAGI